jgi:hypothetical protein
LLENLDPAGLRQHAGDARELAVGEAGQFSHSLNLDISSMI